MNAISNPADGLIVFCTDCGLNGSGSVLSIFMAGKWIGLATIATVTDIDGNVYYTVTIGTQTWMAENLRTTKYRNGDPILNVTDNLSWSHFHHGAYCWYNNDANTYKAYGLLYNGSAISDYQNLAPEGWHVATDAEWTTLTSYLGGTSVAGDKLKETGTTHWNSPNTATNTTGYTALPGGYRDHSDGTFRDVSNVGYWWSYADFRGSAAWNRTLSSGSGYVSRVNFDIMSGCSVRCVRD